jgi:hypothetical protein
MDDRLKALFSASNAPPQSLRGRGSGGAPEGNFNGYKHGLRSTKLGPGMQYINRQAITYRKAVEAETLGVRGKLGIWEQSLLQTSTQWLITALKIERLLRFFDADLNNDQRVAYAEKCARALTERDKCLAKLGLDREDHATLYALPHLPDEPEGQPTAPISPTPA